MHYVVPRRTHLDPTLVYLQYPARPVASVIEPENIVPVKGDVMKGLNMRSTGFCSAMMLFSLGRGWNPNALKTTLMNLMSRLAARARVGRSGGRLDQNFPECSKT